MEKILYIVNHFYKEKMIQATCTTLMNYKYMSIEEFIQNMTFRYEDDAIYYLMRTRDIKYDIAKNYIENIYFIWGKSVNDYKKLQTLKQIKEELESQHLLHTNPLFKQYLKGWKIVVKGYNLSKYEKNVLSMVDSDIEIVYEEETCNNYIPAVYEFDTIEDEIVFVANKIREDLKTIPESSIKISFFDEYKYQIKTIFDLYGISLKLTSDKVLYGNIVCKEWIKTLEETRDSFKTSELLIEKYGFIEPIKKLIEITNMIPQEEVTNIYIDYFRYKCKHIMMEEKIEEGILCSPFLSQDYESHDFVYVLGCNAENMPTIYKDEHFLSDEIREYLGIDTSFSKNEQEKEKWLQKIKNTKNLTLTYKLKTPFESYTKSSLLESFAVQKNPVKNYQYSNLYNKLCLARKIDKLIKYNEKESDLGILYSTYQSIPYQTYSNNFTGIDKEKVVSYLQHKLFLSYSSMNNYYLCKFRYYIQNFLKLDIYEETFMVKIGTLFHYILSRSIERDFDFEKEYKDSIRGENWTSKENFLLKKLKQELKFVIDTVQEQSRYTTFKNTIVEEKMYANPSVDTVFSGIIDKILYKEENGELLVAIIDYKTGTPETNIMNLPYGIEMQLPIYVYLLKHNKNFRNAKVVGFYLQKILNKDFSYDGEDYMKEKKKLLQLDGYSIDNEELLEKFDITYKDSSLIRGMKTSSNGFYKYTKIIKEEEIEFMNTMVGEKILEAKNSIFEGDFSINPKRIEDDLIGCKYCKFKDICYRKEENIINVNKITSLDFLHNK